MIHNYDFLISHAKHDAFFSMKRAHAHPFYELYYMFSGECVYYLDGQSYKLHKGDLLLINKGLAHQTLYSVGKVHERCVLNISEHFISYLFEQFGRDTILKCFDQPFISIPSGRRETFENLLLRIEDEYMLQDWFSEKLLKNLLSELFVFLVRCQNYLRQEVALPDVEDTTIQEITDYISNNYDKTITLKDIARRANMSESYFSKKFKKTTGVGFKEYLLNIRIHEAASRLLETEDSITEIACACGFNYSNYFGDAFKKVKGISPHQYRKHQGYM